MPRTLNLIKGILSETAKNFAAPYVDKALNYMAPKNSFPDGFTTSQDGNVNKSDNWGTFGTFLARTAYDVLTQPLDKTNSALPPTTGSITKFGPAVLSAEPPIKMIQTRGRRAPVRRAIRRGPIRRRPLAKNKRTVNEMVSPQKKKRSYTYRVNI